MSLFRFGRWRKRLHEQLHRNLYNYAPNRYSIIAITRFEIEIVLAHPREMGRDTAGGRRRTYVTGGRVSSARYLTNRDLRESERSRGASR